MEVTSWRPGAVDCTVWNEHHRNVRFFLLFERSEFLIATSPPKNLRVFDYVAAAVLAADADAAVLETTMTPLYVRQKRLLAW